MHVPQSPTYSIFPVSFILKINVIHNSNYYKQYLQQKPNKNNVNQSDCAWHEFGKRINLLVLQKVYKK